MTPSVMTEKKATAVQRKSSRFTDEMNNVLIQYYKIYQGVLKSRFSNTVTHEKKKKSWDTITQAVNAVNTGERKTVEQVKKRWEDMATIVKKKERAARQNELKRLRVTGNGNLPDEEERSEILSQQISPAALSTLERQVADILGPEVFAGINGGMDTLDLFNRTTEEAKLCDSEEIFNIGEEINTMKEERSSSGAVVEDEILETKAVADSVKDVALLPSGPKRRRKITLAEAQLEYFQVATKYYQIKTEKLKLELFKNTNEE